jgi:hypothetical protein
MKRLRVLSMMVLVGIPLGGCADQSSPEPHAAAATPEATRCQALEECEGRVVYLRNPVPNDSRPGQRPQPIVRAPHEKCGHPLASFGGFPGSWRYGPCFCPSLTFTSPS